MKFLLLFQLKNVWRQTQLGRAQQPSASAGAVIAYNSQKKNLLLISVTANTLLIDCGTQKYKHITVRCTTVGQGPPTALMLTPVTAYKD